MEKILKSLKKAIQWYCETTARVYNYTPNGDIF